MMPIPQFQAHRPAAAPTSTIMAPPSGGGGKGNVFGSLARLAYGAATGNPASMFSGGMGLLGLGGGGGADPTAAAPSESAPGATSSSTTTGDITEKEEPAAHIPPIGDLFNAQLWGRPPMMIAPPSPFQSSPSSPNLQMDPSNGIMLSSNLWVNRMRGA